VGTICRLQTKNDFNYFISLSKEIKKEKIIKFVQGNWGDVIGVDHFYTFVRYKNQIYAVADVGYTSTVENLLFIYEWQWAT
jgi:hypothetical protein